MEVLSIAGSDADGKWDQDGHSLPPSPRSLPKAVTANCTSVPPPGAQWQKIALARAFMRDCEVLVLDEPTAALDAENELKVFQQFRELANDKIAVLISRRFSTVRMADRIFVMEKGRITEQGTHAELLAQGGTYTRLLRLQAESYR